MIEVIKALLTRDEETEGQGLVEYALIIVLVSIASMVALELLGVQVTAVFTEITGTLAG